MTRTISFAGGEALVASGRFRRIVDEGGRLVGYQPADGGAQIPVSSNRFDAATITRGELEANAGLRGKSRTKHLPENLREHRLHPKSGRLMPEEDFVERARNKVQAWPHVGESWRGDKAVRVYPKTAVKPGSV